VIQAVEPIMGRPMDVREEDHEPLAPDPDGHDAPTHRRSARPTPTLLDDLIGYPAPHPR